MCAKNIEIAQGLANESATAGRRRGEGQHAKHAHLFYDLVPDGEVREGEATRESETMRDER